MMESILKTYNPRAKTMGFPNLESFYILKLRTELSTYDDASERIITWAKNGESGYVTACDAHCVIQAFMHESYRAVINNSRLNTTDGMPLVLAQKFLSPIGKPTRVCGATLTLDICKKAAENKIPIALYGGTPESLKDFSGNMKKKFPALQIVAAISPPFRACTVEEDEWFTKTLQDSGARIVLVGIGSPKQDFWMSAHESQLSAILLGVGAAFDFHAGRFKRAPEFLQKICLEWLFRIYEDPERLWKRYLMVIPRFLLFFPVQYVFQLFKIDFFNVRNIPPQKIRPLTVPRSDGAHAKSPLVNLISMTYFDEIDYGNKVDTPSWAGAQKKALSAVDK